MTPARFAAQLGLAVGLLVLANLTVQRFARNSVPRQALARGDESPPATDLFVGNSTMAAGLDEQAFAAAKPGRPLNLAIGATGPVEHLMLVRRQERHSRADLYYGFLDTQLTDPPEGDWETLVGNRAMAYYVDPDEAVRQFAPDSPLKAVGLRVVGWVPMLTERHTVWAKVELLRRRLGEPGLPVRANNQFGRVDDFAALEAPPDVFVARCEGAVADAAPLSRPVQAILSSRESGGRAFVIEMPMPTIHRRQYYAGMVWDRYRAHVRREVERAGGVFVTAADWVSDDGFSDHLHLNAEGAGRFSRQLAERVPR